MMIIMTVFPHSVPSLQPDHYKMTMIIVSVFLHFLPPLYSFLPNRFLLGQFFCLSYPRVLWGPAVFQLNHVWKSRIDQRKNVFLCTILISMFCTFLCFAHFCVLHISVFCTLPLPPPHSIWTIKPVAASSTQDRGDHKYRSKYNYRHKYKYKH